MDSAPRPSPARALARARLVVFDCDGVLVDTERIGPEVVAAMATEAGWPLTPADVLEKFLGTPEPYLLAQVRAHAARPVDDGWLVEYRARVAAAFEAAPHTMPGVGELLDALDARGLPYCVASSGSHPRIRHSLTATGLWGRFAGRVFSADDVREGKPAPDLFRHAAAVCGAPAAECLVIEDSPAGVRAARAAGMPVLGYTGGPTPAAWLADADAGTVADLRELLRTDPV
ncbi:haloacid dehalogenase [Streptomyces qinglanensis]|uniref:Haloacid dehalogenase n=1 Tax=Streptomyces qinglanensis TaxID=943816 RepID=A0A1E7K656_9ACTN|nr:HAD-IA family hydrolase [Streptomyces qinglanensis]OEU99407.1 haloacid dehalogenase [Streptomyces qinglanensis]OEV26121.1 haloacid dehalogenase [Streptomyces nanshensis]